MSTKPPKIIVDDADQPASPESTKSNVSVRSIEIKLFHLTIFLKRIYLNLLPLTIINSLSLFFCFSFQMI